MYMVDSTLDLPTRTRTSPHRIDSSTGERKILVFDNSYMWNLYIDGLKGVVEKNNIALTQFLGEARRVAKDRGPFDAYVINLDRQYGSEHTLRDGVDLAERIMEHGEDRELMWFLSLHPGSLETAEARGFHRLYEISGEPVEYSNLNRFILDLRQDLAYGRRGI